MRPRVAMAVRGVLKSVKTMKMEKIWRVEPVMYIPVCGIGPVSFMRSHVVFLVWVESRVKKTKEKGDWKLGIGNWTLDIGGAGVVRTDCVHG